MIEIATRTLADGTMGAEDVLHAAPDGNTDVPAVAESGYKDYETEVRLWLFAPAKTPKDAISSLPAGLPPQSRHPSAHAHLARHLSKITPENNHEPEAS